MPRFPLSIVHLTTFYPPDAFGGDAVHVQRLAEAQARRGHRVSVLYPAGAFALLRRSGTPAMPARRTERGVTVHKMGGWHRALEPFLVHQTGRPVLGGRDLGRLLGAARPDVIHFHNISLAGGVGALALGSAFKLFTAHEYWLACPTHLLFRYGREICQRRTCVRCTLRSGRPPQWWRYTGLRDRMLGHLDRMIFPSSLTERVYREQGIKVPGTVLHHFLPDEYLRTACARGQRRPEADPYFLYVGRLDAVKGVAILLEQIGAHPLPAPLLLAGDGPLRADLQRRFGSGSVRFLGGQNEESLGALYRDALALIVPSAGYEVFGQVVIEAFAHGTPAVVTRVGGPRELIDASEAGFSYGDTESLLGAAHSLCDGPALRADLGRRARAYVSRCHAESPYLERYEALVREGRPS